MNYRADVAPLRALHKVKSFIMGVLVWMACLATVPLQAAGAGDDAVGAEAQAALIGLGQRIYREGIGATGEPIVARGAVGVRLAGKDAACVLCHRRSGFGTSEGPIVIRPIVGPALVAAQEVPVHSPRIKARLGTRVRPFYDEALLGRAIGAGLDAAGKPLDPVMPRYELTTKEIRAVSAYLFSLAARPSPGVDDEDVHFATVIQPGISAAKRSAMLDIMQAFVKDKDANTRANEQRREAGTMRMYRAYRKWVLHVWDLQGLAETWAAQLEALYRERPVFALVGGLGWSSWKPIHEFAERNEIPSVFPQVELPVLDGPNDYNFYLSRGVALEAKVLAKFMRDKATPQRIVQVYRRGDAAGAAAAAAFRAAERPASSALLDLVLDELATPPFFQQVKDQGPAALVLWLGKSDLDRALAQVGAMPTYLSSALLDGKLPEVPVGADLRLIYPSDLPPKHDARMLRNIAWLHGKGIAITDEAVQMNTQFALSVVSDVMGHLVDNFSRDYFVERIEHVVTQTPTPSMYPQVSLGPGQRFAAKGSAIVRLVDSSSAQWKPMSGWIVP